MTRILATSIFLLVSSELWACAVCFSGGGGSRNAYYLATAVMMLLPIGFVAGLAFWITRKAKALHGEEVEEESKLQDAS